MDKQESRKEEIIALTGEQANYYFSLAMNGDIRIKGKFIRDKNGQLRPVLVRTTFLPPEAKEAAETPNHPWGIVRPSPARKKGSWLSNIFSWTQKFIR